MTMGRFDCAECGQGIAVDEDGCCRSCGADAVVVADGGMPYSIVSLEDIAADLWRDLCEGNGEHSESLDKAIIVKHLRRVGSRRST